MAASNFDVAALFDGKLALKGADVPVSQLAGKVVAIYFSAHWCPPCRAFTPTLIKAYQAAKAAGLPFELVFVSSDHDEDGFDEYTADMPWPSVKFDDEDGRTAIKEEFGVKGIPQLHVIGADGALISKDGRNLVAKEKEEAIKAWCAVGTAAPAASAASAASDAFSTTEDF